MHPSTERVKVKGKHIHIQKEGKAKKEKDNVALYFSLSNHNYTTN